MITHVFHFADIHIRNGDLERARYYEYEDVFQKTLDALDTHESVANGTALIVIAGDLFHHKGKMDTPALKLYFSWMDQLLARAPVVMICGNHDFRQEDPRHPDMMETMSIPYEHQRKTKYPLVYLKETGHYHYANVGFGVVSVRDTLKAYNTSGQVAELPEFPSVAEFVDACNVRIALFHGTITQSALPNEHRMSEMHGYPLDWFQGYDLVLLGDNHKQQTHTKPMPWGYPGSLIQQDFGEPTLGHGFLLWDLQKKECTAHHIYNPKGMVTVKWSPKRECYVVSLGKKELLSLEEAVLTPSFPQTPRIRIIGNSGEDVKVREMLSACAPHIKPVSIVTSSSLDPISEDIDQGSDVREQIVHLSDLNEPLQWIEYVKGVAPDLDVSNWFLHPETLRVHLDDSAKTFLPSDIQQKFIDRNTRIQKAIDEYRDNLQTKQNGARICLKNMAWDYAMCYGQGNFFDFQKIANSIALLNGKNASGKSSFLDVLCIGLYGEPTKHRNMLSGKKMSAKMIHDQRPTHKSVMRVSILFALNDEDYEIVRSFTTQKKEDTAYAQLNGAHVYKVDAEKQERRIICEGSVMVDQWVTSYFGSVEDMLMSTIVCQLDLANFFYMKQDEQKAILDHAMQLGSISAFAKVIKEAILAYNDWIALIRTALQTIEASTGGDIVSLTDMERTLEDVRKLKQRMDTMQEENMQCLRAIGDVESVKHLTVKEIASEEKKLHAKLTQYADISENDMEHAMTLKGEKATFFVQCRDTLDALRNALADVEIIPENECHKCLDKLEKKLERHRVMEKPPNVSKDLLTKLEKSLDAWKAKYPEEWVSDPDQVQMSKEELESHLEELKTYQKEMSKKAIARPEGKEMTSGSLPANFSMSQEKRRYNEVCDALDMLRETAVMPVRQENKYAKWKEEWEKWENETKDVAHGESAEVLQKRCEEYETFIRSYKQKEEEMVGMEKEIASFDKELKELAEIPSNPECWACQLQPSAKRRTQIKEHYTKMSKMLIKMKKHVDQYRAHGDICILEKELAHTRKLMNQRMFYEQTAPHMMAEQQSWEQASREWEKKKEWDERLCVLSHEKAEIEQRLHIASWKQWRNWTQKMEAVEQEISETESELALMHSFMSEFEAREKDMILLQEETDRWNDHETWKDTMSGLEAESALYQKMLEYWDVYQKYQELEKEMGIHGKNIERIHQKRELMDRFDVFARVRMYQDWKAKDLEYQTLAQTYQDLHVRHALMQASYKAQQDKKDQIDWYKCHLDVFVDAKQKLSVLESKFVGDKTSSDGYKEWIYREKVVPLVENEVNKFLSTIETIRLRITYEKKCFMYFLEDRGNMPTLDKASGYQNFIVGLAMRLALARIGAIGQNVRHLFIDEGFTACDVTNIEKVPQILHGIMTYGGYQSILLMSHLEHVQDASEKKIDIERKGMFSFIQYGDPYPVFTTVQEEKTEAPDTTKKRGRPKKAM